MRASMPAPGVVRRNSGGGRGDAVVYVIFETPRGEPPLLCCGPYWSVQVTQGQLFVTEIRGDRSERRCLAVQAADGWHVREELGASARSWEAVRFSDSPEKE
jgi:hypothetical protein